MQGKSGEHIGCYKGRRRNRSEFSTTDKELRLIAAPAIIGFSRPNAASGILRPL